PVPRETDSGLGAPRALAIVCLGRSHRLAASSLSINRHHRLAASSSPSFWNSQGCTAAAFSRGCQGASHRQRHRVFDVGDRSGVALELVDGGIAEGHAGHRPLHRL
ncbi:unnamed protein product, partial [Ectocarpus sp. 12 AP-2014]